MSKLYPTPHINATPEDIAKTVLMPGDPLRAKFIAENFHYSFKNFFIVIYNSYYELFRLEIIYCAHISLFLL